MPRVVPASIYTSTEIIEHALLHAAQDLRRCDLCDEKGDVTCNELDLALESRLVNARGLIGAVHDLRDPTALTRTLSTLDHLIEEALQVRALWHRTHDRAVLSLVSGVVVPEATHGA